MTTEPLIDKSKLQSFEDLLDRARSAKGYPELSRLARSYQRLKSVETFPDLQPIRVAVLGGATTDLLKDPLELVLATKGLAADIFQSSYNSIANEILDPHSETFQFKPDVVVLVNTPDNIGRMPALGDSLDQVEELVSEVCDYWLGLCAKLRERNPCEIIINNFHQLPARPLGNLAAKSCYDANNFINRVNIALGDRAPSYVHINDVAGLSAQCGVDRWFDLRYWYHAKQPISFECVPAYVANTASLVGALFGRNKKCVVLDLDNTLWGGVIGDDGIDGIKFGEGDPVGEAFKAFQEYVLQLKQRGILLAICSKNDLENALEPFQLRQDMVLKTNDFAAVRANWDPKPDNIREIANELNIGLDSLVFVDDNPAERAHVRMCLPAVSVIEMTDDPADYPRLLDDSGLFETIAISDADRNRTQQYQENQNRKQLLETISDYSSYLSSLDQQATITPIQDHNVARATQLINKTNQFNLTTRRYSPEQVTQLIDDPQAVTATVSLTDRFGDNGLISVVVSSIDDQIMQVDLWLMSCRVLKRDVEKCLCNWLVNRAKKRDIKQIQGLYIPSKKNSMVREHYSSLGFDLMNPQPDGTTRWTLDVEKYQPWNVAIKVTEN